MSKVYCSRVIQNLSVQAVHNVNRFVGLCEVFIHFFGRCWYQHWGHVFLATEVFCCKDQLIPQPYKANEFCFSPYMIMDLAKVSVAIFTVHSAFYNQVVGIIFGPRKSYKSVLRFSKVHIVGTSDFVQGSTSVVSHAVLSLRWNTAS